MRNPYGVLGVTESATNQEIRTAYLKLLQQWPPEKDAERFQEINDAYHAVENEVLRAKLKLFGLPVHRGSGDDDLTSFFPKGRTMKRAGVDFWLELLKTEQKDV